LLRLTGKAEVLGNAPSVKCIDGHSGYRYTVHQFCLVPVIFTACMPCTRSQFRLIPVTFTACMSCTSSQFCLIPVIYTACMPCTSSQFCLIPVMNNTHSIHKTNKIKAKSTSCVSVCVRIMLLMNKICFSLRVEM
jgi:hypothetical protein